MINRDMKSVQVVSFRIGRDEYGQTRKAVASTRPCLMTIYLASKELVENPMYQDVECVGITKDTAITEENEIVSDGVTYLVTSVIYLRRWTEVYLRKKA